MRSELSLGRGIAIIVAAGTVLGLVYNAAGLMSRPPRGIPWLAANAGLGDLDSLALPASVPGAPATPAGSEAAVPPAPSEAAPPAATDSVHSRTRPPTHNPPGAGDAAARGTTASPPPAAGSAPPAVPGSTATRPVRTAPGDGRAAPPPFIPEADHPVRIQLAVAKSLLDAGAALFVDARDAEEYASGHIPGAVRWTRDDVFGEPGRMKALAASGRPVVTYCSGGECEASLDLARALVDVGCRKVLVFTGGFPEWVAAGYPVESGDAGP